MANKIGIELVLKGNLPQQFKKAGDSGKKALTGIAVASRKATNGIKALGKSIFSLKGLIATGGLVLLTKRLKDATIAQAALQDESVKMARSLGVAVEELTALRRSAQLGGAETATLDAGLRRLSRNLFDASRGIGEANIALDEMGIATTDSNGKLRNTTAVLNDVADSFANMEDGTLKSAQAQLLFGKSGVQLINTLNGGSAALKRQADEAQRLGIIFSSEAAADAEKFNDAVLDLGNALDGAFRSTLEDILPELTPLIKQLTRDIADNKDDIKEFGDTLFNAFKLSIPVIKAVATEIQNASKWWTDFVGKLSDTKYLQQITELATAQAEVTRELRDQEALLAEFEKSGFIPPSIQANVDALDSKLFEITGKLEKIKAEGSFSFAGTGGTEIEGNKTKNNAIQDQNNSFRNEEAEKELEFQKKIAEDQRAFELKKWGMKVDFEKRKRKQAKITADYEDELTQQTLSMGLSAAQELFGENKAFAIADIGLKTLQGVQRSFSDLPPPFSYIQAGIIGALGVKNAADASGMNFAEGGLVQGAGSTTSDSIKANLSPEEFVVKAQAVRNVGVENLESINNGGSMGGDTYITINAGIGSDPNKIAQAIENYRGISKDRNQRPEPII